MSQPCSKIDARSKKKESKATPTLTTALHSFGNKAGAGVKPLVEFHIEIVLVYKLVSPL